MTRSLYLCQTEAGPWLSSIAAALAGELGDGCVRFTPIVVGAPSGPSEGVAVADFVTDPAKAMASVVDRFGRATKGAERVLVVGSGHRSALAPVEYAWNTRIAANLGAPLALVLPAQPEATLRDRANVAVLEARANHAQIAGVLVVGQGRLDPVLLKPVLDVPLHAVEQGSQAEIVVADGSLTSLLDRLTAQSVLLLDGADWESALGVALGAAAGQAAKPAGAIVAGDALPEEIARIWSEQLPDTPLDTVPCSRDDALRALSGVSGRVGAAQLLAQADRAGEPATTPIMFEARLLQRAREAGRHIVLPEGEDDRILIAAHRLLAEEVCRLTILGDPEAIRRRAGELELDLGKAELVDPASSELRERFAKHYAELRAKKGVTLEQAMERMLDVSYFGTMMVLEGVADGMVSGAAHTTAHTIRPSLEVIKTRPGVSVVSSVFLMCLADQVLVYGDCAVNPNPTPEQLAEIAISSGETAVQFGIDPRIAMLSYSTGTSGSGPDVDATVAATELVRSKAPHLVVDGPLQYDAAVDPTVGEKKMPGSSVAGRATVLVFPDLKSGNIAYKAVQRSADALALGPILQGLNKPVNDLSRGALVSDIINTVAITAIQAGAQA